VRKATLALREARSQLAAEVAGRSEAVSRRRRRVDARRKRLRAAAGVVEEVREKYLGQGGDAGVVLVGLETTRKAAASRVVAEKKKLVRQLAALFPIEGDDCIAGLRVFGGVKEEARAAALATVVRVLLIAAGYLSLPLPFKMEFLGAKASIGRWGSDEPQIMLTGDGLAMREGLAMLRKNVEALCFYQGIPPALLEEWSLVHSLWQLFHSPSLGNSVLESLHQADTRIGKVRAGRPLRPPEILLPMSVDEAASMPSLHSGAESPIPDGNATSEQKDNKGDNWDLIERPQPPKPSKDDDIQHWLSSGAGES